MRTSVIGAIAFAATCWAQEWEIGATAGYGEYSNATIATPGGQATAGIDNGFAVGAVFGEELYNHLSGEIRYTYQNGDMFLSSGGTRATLGEQSHAIHYDMLFHLLRKSEPVRPYLAVGVGAKDYVGTSIPIVAQPLSNIALLTSASEFKPAVTWG